MALPPSLLSFAVGNFLRCRRVLTLSGGILCYGNNKTLYIHCQSYGSSMGKLICQSGYNDSAAGIGSDRDGETTDYKRTPGDLEIHGGDIYAQGGTGGAGIGGGQSGRGGNVSITGGTVIAKAGRQVRPEVETGNRAIGPGEGCDDYGKLTIGNRMMVQAGYNGETYEGIFTAGERVPACWYRSSARIEPCTHSSLTYTVSGTGNEDTHTAHCKYCTTEFTPQPHDYTGGSTCSVCGVETTTTLYTIRTYLPSKVGGAYDGQTYSCQTTQMALGTTFNMPDCPTIVPGLEFKGWEVSNVTANPYTSTYTTTNGGTIKNVGDSYTISGDVTFIARYQNLDIILKDNESNGEVLSTHDGLTVHNVTLSGRTLFKDGKWNTLCLPFGLTAEQVTAQLAPTSLMELDVDGWYDGNTRYTEEAEGRRQTGFDNGTLYLNFKTATSSEAGKPYIIKWASGSDISEVTINSDLTNVECADGTLAFVGTYSPLGFDATDQSILFLGEANTLYYPQSGATIGAQRAYFALNGITASDVTLSRLLFDGDDEGEATGVESVESLEFRVEGNEWYTISGVKLEGQPTEKGVYIHNGKKVVIK